MSGIEGKVVVITGASSGIGEATALLLAERGARVVLGARGPDRLAARTDRIVKAGGQAAYAPTDVKRRDQVSALVKLACERYGKVDVLVNNAGVMPVSPLDDLRVEDWEEMIDVNIKGVLYGIAAALPVFRAQGSGHFVNIASTAGHKTVPNQSVYSGTKFALALNRNAKLVRDMPTCLASSPSCQARPGSRCMSRNAGAMRSSLSARSHPAVRGVEVAR
jgi:NADP-dependent 3-hydroxy acid dehydrogenase YdfG